jgi:hypothetical protein
LTVKPQRRTNACQLTIIALMTSSLMLSWVAAQAWTMPCCLPPT